MAEGSDVDPYQPTALLNRSLNDVENLGEKAAGKALILEMNESAGVMGVRRGMTAAQGQARYAGLRLCYRSVKNETALRSCFLEIADRFTPDYEDTAAGICTLDLVGSHFGRAARAGCEGFAEEAMQMCERRGLEVRIGIARHPDLSLLAARLAEAGAPRILLDDGAESGLRRELGALAVSALDPPPGILKVLTLWGIHTLGELTELSRDAVTARLGVEVLPLWALATGGASRLLRLVRTPEVFEECVDLEHEVMTLEPLLFPIRRVLETLTARLSSVWFVAQRIDLALLSRAGAIVYRAQLRIPEPCSDVEFLFQRVHRHLENFAADQPVTGMTLRIDPVRAKGHQFHLFESNLRDPNRFAETLAEIEALLSGERAGIPSYVPMLGADTARVVPFDEKILQGGKTGDLVTGECLPLEIAIRLGPPLRRFRPARPVYVRISPGGEPLAVTGHAFTDDAPLSNLRGPWLLSGNWWQPSALWQSKEWDIQTRDGLLIRLSCQSLGWFSQGVYG